MPTYLCLRTAAPAVSRFRNYLDAFWHWQYVFLYVPTAYWTTHSLGPPCQRPAGGFCFLPLIAAEAEGLRRRRRPGVVERHHCGGRGRAGSWRVSYADRARPV
jgi:hypothetical protein